MKKNHYIIFFILVVLIRINAFSQANECNNIADPKNYSEFKSLFQSIELGANTDISASFCLSKKNMFYPYSEESYEIIYPLGMITNYRGLDIFTLLVSDTHWEGEEKNVIELWVFKDKILRIVTTIDYGYVSKGETYMQQFTFTKDTMFLVHSLGLFLGPKTDLSMEITFDETTKYMIVFDDTVNYRYDDKRIFRAVEFSNLRYASPYFFPEKAILWEQNGDYRLYPTEQSPFGFYPPEYSMSSVSCWFYVTEKKGKYSTTIVSKNKQGNEISKMIITPKEDGHECSYTIKTSKTTRIESESDIKNTAIIETSIGDIMLKPNGELIKTQK